MQPASQGHDMAAEGEANQRIPRYKNFTGPEFQAFKRSARYFHFNIYLPNKKLFESCDGSIDEAVVRDLFYKAELKTKQEDEMRLAASQRCQQIVYSSDDDEEEEEEEDHEKIKKRLKELEDHEKIKKRLKE